MSSITCNLKVVLDNLDPDGVNHITSGRQEEKSSHLVLAIHTRKVYIYTSTKGITSWSSNPPPFPPYFLMNVDSFRPFQPRLVCFVDCREVVVIRFSFGGLLHATAAFTFCDKFYKYSAYSFYSSARTILGTNVN